ncbi:substrate-binding domain-containing protein [Oribacterium sp. WCC10]|uniref:substrate-binding domain-containing protein n=1 Tax=Oribacterium sp. WCC10 TaxID=1855343 RepID=UPI0008EE4D06|nr:sugar-binding protein [Oribacterium sp. WCC10]SFG13474.1 putative multiple sugar transport system substrate-binding protein [Oribacterium sp. WCC10]
MNNDDTRKDKWKFRKKVNKETEDADLQWESLKYNPIRMNKRNVNQNLAEKHTAKERHRKKVIDKILFIICAVAIGTGVFMFMYLLFGHKIKLTKPKDAFNVVKETTLAEKAPTIEESTGETYIVEATFPGNDVEGLNVIGGNGELIGFSFPSQYDKKWLLLEKYFGKVMNSVGYDTEFKYASYGPNAVSEKAVTDRSEAVAQQISDIKDMVEDGARMIFTAPVDVNSVEYGKLLTEIKNQGIYVIALDHVPMNTDGVNYLFGCDDYHVGEVIGKYIVKELGLETATAQAPKTVEIFTGAVTDDTLLFLYPGLMETLFPYIDAGSLVIGSGQMELEQVTALDNSENDAYERMKNLIRDVYSKKTLDAVICTDDYIASGVSRAMVEAIEQGEYAGSFPVITGDGCDDEALERILQGKQSMTLLHEPTEYAVRGAELVDAVIHGNKVSVSDSEMYQNGSIVVQASELEPVVITAENYEEMILNKGYLQTTVLID